MRISRQAQERHAAAMKLVDRHHAGQPLTLVEREQVLDDYREDAQHLNGRAGAFFTPRGLAGDLGLHVPDGARVLDLCAGVGSLSAPLMLRDEIMGRRCDLEVRSVVCVEQNPDYVRVGQAALPAATWVQADVFDVDAYRHLGPFDCVISNPPFGRIKTGAQVPGARYDGGLFDLRVVELASTLARYGVFILPQTSAPFRYSGRRSLEWVTDGVAARFTAQTGLRLRPNVGVDCATYRDDWHGTAPLVEVVVYDPDEE